MEIGKYKNIEFVLLYMFPINYNTNMLSIGESERRALFAMFQTLTRVCFSVIVHKTILVNDIGGKMS